MKTILYTADTRGHADHGWLNTYHTFSFAQYHNPERVHFGMLRVLNDDVVAPGMGFGQHPHDNMEIISIPLKGALAHKDSTGTVGVIHTGDVQIMSAGSGLTHSEMNASHTEEVNFLQIWVFPKEKNIKPRYDQKTYDSADRQNRWQIVVSPDLNTGGLWINQDATFALTDLTEGQKLAYTLNNSTHGVYIFVLEGEVAIGGNTLRRRDGIGISEVEKIDLVTAGGASVLLMEIPM